MGWTVTAGTKAGAFVRPLVFPAGAGGDARWVGQDGFVLATKT